jgi:thiamine transport system ATP-binding protein
VTGLEDDRVTVAVGDHEFTVAADGRTSGERAESGAADGRPEGVATGDPVTVCVRPEALSPDEPRNGLEVAVEGTEFLGEAVRAWGSWDGRRVVVRLREPPDDRLEVGFAPEDAHLLRE